MAIEEPRLFWVTCPRCSGRYCCAWLLRHQDVLLLCPYCQHRFKQEESPRIEE